MLSRTTLYFVCSRDMNEATDRIMEGDKHIYLLSGSDETTCIHNRLAFNNFLTYFNCQFTLLLCNIKMFNIIICRYGTLRRLVSTQPNYKRSQ